MALKRIYAPAIGGPVHGRWIEGEKGRTLNVAPRVTASVVNEWNWKTDPVNGAAWPEVYNLWYYKAPGWLVAVPLWVHHSYVLAANHNGYTAPQVPWNMLPASLRDYPFLETCPIQPRAHNAVDWRLA